MAPVLDKKYETRAVDQPAHVAAEEHSLHDGGSAERKQRLGDIIKPR